MTQNEPTERAPHGQSWKRLSKKKKKKKVVLNYITQSIKINIDKSILI